MPRLAPSCHSPSSIGRDDYPSVFFFFFFLVRIVFKGPVAGLPLGESVSGGGGLKSRWIVSNATPFLRGSGWDSMRHGFHGSRCSDPTQENASARDRVLFPGIPSHETGPSRDSATLGKRSILDPERRVYLEVSELHTNVLEVHLLPFFSSGHPAPAYTQKSPTETRHWVTTMDGGRPWAFLFLAWGPSSGLVQMQTAEPMRPTSA